MPTRIAIAAAMIVALAGPAAAQPLIKPRVIQLAPVELENGKVVAVQPGMIAATNPAGERWALQISNETVVRVLGEAESDMLQVRQFVRVVATVDKRQSKVKDKVKSITLTVPAKDPDRMPGVFYPGQEGGGDLTPPAKGPLQPKAAPPVEPPAPAKPTRPAAKGKDREPGKDGRGADNEELLDVRGYIVKINKKKDQLALEVPNAPFKSPLSLELDPEVKDLRRPARLLDGQARRPSLGPRLSTRPAVDGRPRTGHHAECAADDEEAAVAKIGCQATRAARQARRAGALRGGRSGRQEQAGRSAGQARSARQRDPGRQGPTAGQGAAGRRRRSGRQDPPRLEPEARRTQGQGGAEHRLDAGDPLVFIPAKEEPVENIRKQFGDPKEVQNVQGSLPIGEEGARKDVRWQAWTYGTLKIFVDETGKTRYFHLGKK